MTTDRRFCRFARSKETDPFGMPEVPEDGLCLSAFVILSPEDDPSSVLMGHMNPAAPWDHLGAMDPGRVEAHRHGWMLPSSHLILQESPEEAARRVLAEQLELPPLPLEGPKVVSEVGPSRRYPTRRGHWDLEFLFRGRVRERDLPSPEAWTELRFVDLRTIRKMEIARSHDEVLASAGFRLND
ncbi:MAG: NUDIX hydrolase [Thermoplasmata archaeon]|nr:NUDIX hydrolase [Thermoplasmata archaeon]